MTNDVSNPVPESSAGFSLPDLSVPPARHASAVAGIARIPTRIADHNLPTIAVGVLSFNRADEVIRTLELLSESDYPPEKLHLVVVDNASGDDTVRRVATQFGDRVEVISLARNIGAIARNHVLMRRSEAYLFQFDDDCAPLRRDTIRRAVELLEANRGIGALCFRSVNLHTGRTEYGDFGLMSRRRLPNGGFEGITVMGGGMAFRREDVQSTAGYDERVFWGGEELQLGLEFLYRGIRIIYHPDLTLVHRQAPRSLTRVQQLEVDMRNNVLIAFIFYPLPLACTVTLIRILRHGLAAVAKRKPGGLVAVLRGVRRGLLLVPGAFASRRTIPISRVAEHNRWFFASFVSLPPAGSGEAIAPEILRRAVEPHRNAPAVAFPDRQPVP